MSSDQPKPPAEPLLRVVRGEPTDEELAALVVALAAVQPGPEPEPEPDGPSAWATYERTHHGIPDPGPGAWRFSLR